MFLFFFAWCRPLKYCSTHRDRPPLPQRRGVSEEQIRASENKVPYNIMLRGMNNRILWLSDLKFLTKVHLGSQSKCYATQPVKSENHFWLKFWKSCLQELQNETNQWLLKIRWPLLCVHNGPRTRTGININFFVKLTQILIWGQSPAKQQFSEGCATWLSVRSSAVVS